MTSSLFLAGVVVLAAGCSSAAVPDSTTLADTSSTSTEPGQSLSPIPDHVLIDLDGDVIDAVLETASEELDLNRTELEPVVAVAVTWSDDSLNCSQDGRRPTAYPVKGLWVVLTDGQRIFDYRAGENSEFARCEGGGPPAQTHVGS